MTDNLKLQLTPSRRGIAGQGGVVHLDVTVTPPVATTSAPRRPVAVALVMDRSGSMASPAIIVGPLGAQGAETPSKLEYVTQAAVRMLELMPDGDAVALVTFDDAVRVEKPLTVLSKQSRRALVRAVSSIRTGGSTNLDGGLRSGIEQLAVGGASYSSRLVILSDGMANVGEHRPAVLGEVAAGAAHNGTTISTLGVGVDYHLGMMTHLAECGNGAFHHIDNLADLEPILTSEFLDAAAVTARNVEVTLRVPEGVAVGTNLSRLPQTSIDGGVRIGLGDPVRPREFLIELTTPVSLSGDTLRIDAMVEELGADGALLEVATVCELPLLSEVEVEALPVENAVVAKVVERLQVKADMDAAPSTCSSPSPLPSAPLISSGGLIRHDTFPTRVRPPYTASRRPHRGFRRQPPHGSRFAPSGGAAPRTPRRP